jgi:hypothetical protein
MKNIYIFGPKICTFFLYGIEVVGTNTKKSAVFLISQCHLNSQMSILFSVQPLELVNEAELSPDEDINEDSDNEDDENNWRNDYPDEESSNDEDGPRYSFLTHFRYSQVLDTKVVAKMKFY